MTLLTLEEAQAALLDDVEPLRSETLKLAEAQGRYSSAPVLAKRTQPANDLSAMDGYALRFDDLPGPLRLIGESAAGARFEGAVGEGECVRISTGARLPEGTDCVAMQEDVQRDGNSIRVGEDGPKQRYRHVRRAGSDFGEGDRLIEAGVALGPAHLALAAMGGHGALSVGGAPRIALYDSGNELVAPGEPIRPDHIPATNGLMLEAMLAELPCSVVDRAILPDDRDAIAQRLDQVEANLILTTGGASVGDHDHMAAAIEQAGGTVAFAKVAIRPGKPVMHGRIGDTRILGLPGNPVSAFVTAMLFALPLVRRLAGAANPLPPRLSLPLGADVGPGKKRTELLRAQIRDGRVHPLEGQDSAMLRELSRSDALLVRQAGCAASKPGDASELILL